MRNCLQIISLEAERLLSSGHHADTARILLHETEALGDELRILGVLARRHAERAPRAVSEILDAALARCPRSSELAVIRTDAILGLDAALVVEAIVQLVREAGETIPEGWGALSIRCDADAAQARVAVIARRRGVPLDAPGDNGIGLAVARHVATLHGGSLRVESVEPEALAFVLELPAR